MVDIYFEALHPALCKAGKRPEPAISHRPKWWDDMPYYYGEYLSDAGNKINHKKFATVKNCPAISDSMTFGYMLYAQFDFFLDATDENMVSWLAPDLPIDAYQFSEMSIVTVPGNQNYSGFPAPVGFHKSLVKVSPLWSVKTPPGYSVWVTHPLHQNNLPLRTVDGVVDSDRMPAVFPLNFWIKQGFAGTIKAGTPLAQVIPFKRDDFEAHYGEVDIQEMKNLDDVTKSRFTNAYKRLDWVRKRFK